MVSYFRHLPENLTRTICCTYPASVVVSDCSFDDCHSMYPKGGGALFLNLVASCVGVTDSNVTACSAGWGGGAWICESNVSGLECAEGVECGVVSGCRFSECSSIATDYLGGAGLLYERYPTLDPSIVHLLQIQHTPFRRRSLLAAARRRINVSQILDTALHPHVVQLFVSI